MSDPVSDPEEDNREQIEVDYTKVDMGTANLQAWMDKEEDGSDYIYKVYGAYANDLNYYSGHMSSTIRCMRDIDDYPTFSLRGFINRLRYRRLYWRLRERFDVEVEAIGKLDMALFSFLIACSESRDDPILIIQAERRLSLDRKAIMRRYRQQVAKLGFQI